MNENDKKLCVNCSKPLKGRTDKKFCDDFCRNFYNNQLKAGTSKIVRDINNVLARNRRIIEQLLNGSEDAVKISRNTLLEKGFLFKYNTHTLTNKKGNKYFFCYDMGYLPLDNDWYLLVKHKDRSN